MLWGGARVSLEPMPLSQHQGQRDCAEQQVADVRVEENHRCVIVFNPGEMTTCGRPNFSNRKCMPIWG